MGNCGLAKSSPKEEEDDNHFSKEELEAKNVTLINNLGMWKEKTSEAHENKKMVVVNFSASWCGPCKNILPSFCSLADSYTSLMFLIVDVDELAEFSTSWDIKATPTFFFLKGGQKVDKLIGANKEELQRKTAALADSATSSNS